VASTACVENEGTPETSFEAIRTLPLRDRLVLVRRLAERVQQLHAGGSVHRRIAQRTIRFDDQLQPQLSEPSPWRRFGRDETDFDESPPQLNSTTTIELPSDLAAATRLLERAGHAVDPRRIDVYQLGALLCWLVTGHTLRDYALSPTVKNLVPSPVRQVLAQAIGFDADECYPDCSSLIRGLDQALLAVGTAAGADAGPPLRRLGHFEILERIGAGGMGDVYKGYDEMLRRVVAVKVLPPELARRTELVERFRFEAAAAAHLHHPNLLSVYYAGEDAGHYFFAMPYVDGRSLDAWLENAAPPARHEALDVVQQCLSGLDAMRAQGIVHRDIKPANILVERGTGRAVLIDFGIARWIDGETGLTAPGTRMGTADFMAPEQARGERADHRADVYSMGVLLYRLLAGRLPFSGDTAAAVLYQHAHQPPPALANLVPDVPPPLARIVERMLEKDPEHRYQTAGEVLRDLREFHQGPPAFVAAVAAPHERRRIAFENSVSRRTTRWILSTLALGLAVCLAVWALWPPSPATVTTVPDDPPSSALAADRVPPEPPWVDVIPAVDPARDAVSGDWRREDAGVTTGPEPYSRLLLPVQLAGSYDLITEFTRLDGDGMVGLVFPVGPRTCTLQFGASSVHGLERIDGLLVDDPSNRIALRPGRLTNGHRYTLSLAVRTDGASATIEAALDGQPVISWSGRLSALDVLDVWSLPLPDRPAIAAHGAIVTFHTAAFQAAPGTVAIASESAPPAVHPGDGDWIDLIADADVERDTLGGWWLARDGELSVAPSAREKQFVRLMFARPIERNYDLSADFTRTSGNGSVTITIPVGTRQGTLHFGADGGSVGGLERVNGQNIVSDRNPAVRRPNRLIDGRRYQTLVRVRTEGDNATIEVWLDGNRFVRWAGRQAALGLDPNWMLPERQRVAVGCSQANVTFHTVRVRQQNDLPPAS
jgi:predicted Ser/Thr protein kinase